MSFTPPLQLTRTQKQNLISLSKSLPNFEHDYYCLINPFTLDYKISTLKILHKRYIAKDESWLDGQYLFSVGWALSEISKSQDELEGLVFFLDLIGLFDDPFFTDVRDFDITAWEIYANYGVYLFN